MFQRKAAFGAWVWVAFDGATPELTDEMLVEHEKATDAEPEFYPDEEWPDE